MATKKTKAGTKLASVEIRNERDGLKVTATFHEEQRIDAVVETLLRASAALIKMGRRLACNDKRFDDAAVAIFSESIPL